jgi:hypothetical protein
MIRILSGHILDGMVCKVTSDHAAKLREIVK